MCLTYDLTVEIRRQCWVLVCQTLDFQISAQEGIFKIDVLKKGPITGIIPIEICANNSFGNMILTLASYVNG